MIYSLAVCINFFSFCGIKPERAYSILQFFLYLLTVSSIVTAFVLAVILIVIDEDWTVSIQAQKAINTCFVSVHVSIFLKHQ